MKENEFINKNTVLWIELKDLSNKFDKKGINKLNSEELRRFLHLFRQCSHHLAYARTHFPGSDTVVYLNSLIGQAHNHIYSVKKNSFLSIFQYILHGFPKLLREYKKYILTSFFIFFLGFIFSIILVMINEQNASYFLSQQMIESAKSTSNGPNGWNYPLMSSFIMVNNIGVALKAFVLGITLGIGTIYILFQNGLLLGALTALIYKYGNPLNYWSLILPHGVMELTAIFISGAAGLIIAHKFLVPGEHSRKHGLISGAKKAASLLFGIILLLIIAAIIEGFFTPLPIDPIVKLIFALATVVILTFYFSLPYYRRH